ncbi:PepSY-associated TM helix domain-containing protein [Gilvimarinus japonicus]|uniref:PepSY-associated TM helix domain-containing protein n=1 Tax=Gilvimarinus japonicus TaxID=1796469 RepID=A0ABV7HQZ9_9GAMM
MSVASVPEHKRAHNPKRSASKKAAEKKSNKKSQWARWSRTLHWTSSAIGLVALLFFSITGVTLNHPDWFKADRKTVSRVVTLPESSHADWLSTTETEQLQLLLGVIDKEFGLGVPRQIDRDEVEWFFDYPRPGGVASVVYDVELGELMFESTSDGSVSLINDLHKGRHSGAAWSLFIDVSAILGVFMSITGLLLLVLYAPKRNSTWPLVGLGLLVPMVIYVVFVP